MASTTGGAIKQLTEAAGLGLSAYRDTAPAAAVLPYVVITDGISYEVIPGGDGGRGDTLIEDVQLDLYQAYLNPATQRVNESSILADSLRRYLHGAAPSTAGGDTPVRIFGIRIPFSTRGRRADDNTVRTRMSVQVRRAL